MYCPCYHHNVHLHVYACEGVYSSVTHSHFSTHQVAYAHQIGLLPCGTTAGGVVGWLTMNGLCRA